MPKERRIAVGLFSQSRKLKVHEAVRRNDVKALKRAVRSAGSLDEWDDNGWTALHIAVSEERVECAKILLESGANPNVAEEPAFDSSSERWFANRTPLYYAILGGNEQLIKLLNTNGADVDDLSGNGTHPYTLEPDPPLVYAIMKGKANIVRLLVQHGANVKVVDHGETMLQVADYWCRGKAVWQDILDTLRQAGAT